MRRSTWDSASANPGFSCSTLVLEGANIFSAPHDSSRPKGVQRQPLHKHNLVLGQQETVCRQNSTSRRLQSSQAGKAAVWDPAGRCSTSAVGCGRSSHDYQPPTPGRAGSPQFANWHKQHIHAAASAYDADCKHTLEELPEPSSYSPTSCNESAGNLRKYSGSPAGQVPSTLPPRCVPQGRRASWDSHKCLAFTPPASLTNDRRSRRMSLGLPGGSGKQSQSEDGSILRLPPLTPPGAETNPTCVASAANLLAASTVPDQDLAAVKPACANNVGRPGQSPEQLIAPVQTTALAHLVLKDTGRLELRAAVRSQPPLADDADCSRLTHPEAAIRVVQPQQQGANPRTLTQQSVRAQTLAEDSWQATANATACDTGQIGPPITRMRPAVVSTSSTPARRASSKEQAAADSLQSAAEAILLDALLCGWEQHGNDGELYPLTIALEKEGDEGADLQKLQLASHKQIQLHAVAPPVPHGSPSRSKAGKLRPRRRWQQE